MADAMTCISLMKQVDSVCVKGIFKRKANERAQELEWQRLILDNNLA